MSLLLSEDSYSDIWGQWVYEQISFLIDDDGIIRIDWASPYKIESTLIEQAQLLPFHKIHAIFDKMMPAAYAYSADSDGEILSVEIELTKVYLGLQRIAEQNSISDGLLVPLWCFYGIEKKQKKTAVLKNMIH